MDQDKLADYFGVTPRLLPHLHELLSDLWELGSEPELVARWLAERGLTLGKELNVKLHYFTWCGPDHVAFVLLEADTLSAVARYVFSIPMKQKINIVPVEHLHDTIAMAKAATAQAHD